VDGQTVTVSGELTLPADVQDDEASLPIDRDDARRRTVQFSEAIAVEALTLKALADTLKGAKKFIEQAAREYAERFLYELIQNAYDAQPASSAGRVAVVLEAGQGPFGTVYVANTGTPFRHKDFRSIARSRGAARGQDKVSATSLAVFDNRALLAYLAPPLCRPCATSATTSSSGKPRAFLASRRRPSATGTVRGRSP